VPYAQSTREHLSFVVRAAGDPLLLVGDVRREVAALDGELAIAKLRPLADYLERAARPARFTMVLAAIFAALALALSAVGLYGVIAASVSQRPREPAVPLPLRAAPPRPVRQVVREGLALTFVGLALGAAAALLTGRFLGALLYGVDALDALTYLVATALLPAAALAASWLPARRAGQGSPMSLLRAD